VRTLERRLGVVGAVIGFLSGLAWAVATIFTVPVLIVEGVGPIDAVKRSVAIMKQRWGVSVRSSLRIAVPVVLLSFAASVVFVGGVAVAAVGTGAAQVAGILVAAVAVLVLLGVATVSGALITYSRTLVYRYAVGLPVPGIAPELLDGVFVARKRRSNRR
jgi:hypothetical protein